MSITDKIKHGVEELKGEFKEHTGKAKDDPQLEAEGKYEQSEANLKQAGDNVKDAFR